MKFGLIFPLTKEWGETRWERRKGWKRRKKRLGFSFTPNSPLPSHCKAHMLAEIGSQPPAAPFRWIRSPSSASLGVAAPLGLQISLGFNRLLLSGLTEEWNYCASQFMIITLTYMSGNKMKSSPPPSPSPSPLEGWSQKVEMAPGWGRACLPFQKIDEVVCTFQGGGPNGLPRHGHNASLTTALLAELYFPLRRYNPDLWKVLCLWKVLVWG